MTYLQQLRGFDVPVLLVDGGDIFFRNATRKAPSSTEEGRDWRDARALLGAYNLMGYQAIAVGPNDLQLGLSKLQALEKLARFPFLCANLVDSASKKPYFQPYEIIEVGGVRFGVYAVVQQQLNPTPPDPIQAKVMKIMPIAFSVFFFFFPAGLVLYWLVNNVLSIAQQWQITRMIERENRAGARKGNR